MITTNRPTYRQYCHTPDEKQTVASMSGCTVSFAATGILAEKFKIDIISLFKEGSHFSRSHWFR
jgi:hypothetical protein